MDKLLEKIKMLDKKVLVGIGIAIAIGLIFVIVLFVVGNSGNRDNEDSQNNSPKETEMIGTTIEENVTEENVTESLTTENVDEDETVTESEQDEVSDGGNQSNTGTVNPDGEEILGGGDKSDPYLEILSADKTVTTVAVAPGKSVFYGIYRVGGMHLTIEDADAYVIYEGKRYNVFCYKY